MHHSTCPANCSPQLVGDPIDTLTGAVTDQTLDFRLIGPIELWWNRYYDSSKSNKRFALGWGQTHEFDRSLRFDIDGLRYHGLLDNPVGFPPLRQDGEMFAFAGMVLRRVTQLRYELSQHAQPTMEFQFHDVKQPARLKRLFRRNDQIVFNYTTTGRLERITDSAGRVLLINEDAAGVVQSVTLAPADGKPGQTLVTYKYDQRGNLINASSGTGKGFVLTYDVHNRMTRRTGRKGFNFIYEYDSQGRCIHSTGDSHIHEVRLTYEIPGRVTKVTRADGGEWTYMFDDAGGLIQVLDPLGGVQQYVRDKDGKLAAAVDPAGNETKTVYDAHGAPVAKVTPSGHMIPLPEDPNRPDPLTRRVASTPSEYEFGLLFESSKIKLPDAAEAAALTLPADVRNLLTIRPNSTMDAETAASRYQARPLGTLWWPDPERGRFFNEFGKLVAQFDDFGRRRQWSYDASGNNTEFVDLDGGNWSTDRGKWHLRHGETNPVGATVTFTFTPHEKIASCTDAGGTRTEYAYDLKDQLIEVRRHGVTRDRYIADSAGNLLAKHAADGRELIRYQVGLAGRILKRSLSSGDEHDFEYGPRGRVLAGNTARDKVELKYDAAGNLCTEKRNGMGVESLSHGARHPAKSTFFDRFVVRYSAIPGSLVITDPGGKKHRLRVSAGGIVEREFSNHTREIAQYDARGRCQFKSTRRAAGVVWSRRYHWSGEGELQRITDNLRGEAHHEYDPAHRLRSRSGGGKTSIFEFDSADNLIAQPGLAVTLQSGNRLATANGLSVTHNDRNHVATRQQRDGLQRFTYDSRDQLVAVDGPDGSWTAQYDAFNRRTRKTFNGQTTEYYWQGDQIIAEIQHDGRLRLYIYADPLAVTPMLFLDYDSLESPPESCKRYFVFSDQIGTPLMIEDEAGAEVWKCDVEPFGRASVSRASTIQFNLRFPGHYFDAELSLHYNRNRYFDPALARYLQSDPWGIAGGFNLYAYRANPLLQVDVRGLGEDKGDDGECATKEKEGQKDKKDGKGDDLDEKYGEPQPPTKVKDHEKNPDGSIVKNPDLQEVTPGNPPNLDPNKQWLWLVDSEGRLLVGAETPVGPKDPDGYQPKLGHPTLVDGQPARMGGELKPNPDGSWSANNNSGRYSEHPDRGPDQLNNVNDRFKDSGLNMGDPVDNPNRRNPKK